MEEIVASRDVREGVAKCIRPMTIAARSDTMCTAEVCIGWCNSIRRKNNLLAGHRRGFIRG